MEKFKMDDVHVEVACDVLVNLNEVKEFVKGRVELQEVRASVQYIRGTIHLAKEVKNHTVDFVEYAHTLEYLDAYREGTLNGGITTQAVIQDHEFIDDYAVMHRPIITLKTDLTPEPLLTFVEAYRELGFNLKNDRTVTCLKRRINKDRASTNVPYETPEQYVAWIRRQDLSQDLGMNGEIEKAVNERIDEFKPTTDGLEELLGETKRYVKMQGENFRNSASDPAKIESNIPLMSGIVKNTLYLTLHEIADEICEMDKHELSAPALPSIFERIKDAMHHQEGTVFVGDERI